MEKRQAGSTLSRKKLRGSFGLGKRKIIDHTSWDPGGKAKRKQVLRNFHGEVGPLYSEMNENHLRKQLRICSKPRKRGGQGWWKFEKQSIKHTRNDKIPGYGEDYLHIRRSKIISHLNVQWSSGPRRPTPSDEQSKRGKDQSGNQSGTSGTDRRKRNSLSYLAESKESANVRAPSIMTEKGAMKRRARQMQIYFVSRAPRGARKENKLHRHVKVYWHRSNLECKKAMTIFSDPSSYLITTEDGKGQVTPQEKRVAPGTVDLFTDVILRTVDGCGSRSDDSRIRKSFVFAKATLRILVYYLADNAQGRKDAYKSMSGMPSTQARPKKSAGKTESIHSWHFTIGVSHRPSAHRDTHDVEENWIYREEDRDMLHTPIAKAFPSSGEDITAIALSAALASTVMDPRIIAEKPLYSDWYSTTDVTLLTLNITLGDCPIVLRLASNLLRMNQLFQDGRLDHFICRRLPNGSRCELLSKSIGTGSASGTDELGIARAFRVYGLFVIVQAARSAVDGRKLLVIRMSLESSELTVTTKIDVDVVKIEVETSCCVEVSRTDVVFLCFLHKVTDLGVSLKIPYASSLCFSRSQRKAWFQRELALRRTLFFGIVLVLAHSMLASMLGSDEASADS
ncbi:hypothetical protein Tco_0953409 [Tanacetum coccineum]|uniref:Uncharacterized protein n=1 Tax=Tanacetum coccineum TaxID=301880 RepID=A0ABQ5E452_9ASTR